MPLPFLCVISSISPPPSPRYSGSPFFPFEAFSFCFSALLFLPYQAVPVLIGLCLFHDPLFRHPLFLLTSLFLRLAVPSLSRRTCPERLLPFPRLAVPTTCSSFTLLFPLLAIPFALLFLFFSVPSLSTRACADWLLPFPRPAVPPPLISPHPSLPSSLCSFPIKPRLSRTAPALSCLPFCFALSNCGFRPLPLSRAFLFSSRCFQTMGMIATF
ncbi:hypothetical protein BBC0122_016910 [Bartonella choladocola]|uniref:Transmembrane protein n=1 Tax=Bartonella choladocola TaxID=2750995 RepID=A0A1U9MJE3_9HYPH|nr:hypothetical protein BBC0122_016910 [Bartonella choladocola]